MDQVDVIGGQGAAHPDCGGGAGDPTFAGTAQMGRIQVDAGHGAVGADIGRGGHRCQALGQHAGGAAMPQAEGLRVAGHRTAGHGPGWSDLEPLGAHLVVQGAA